MEDVLGETERIAGKKEQKYRRDMFSAGMCQRSGKKAPGVVSNDLDLTSPLPCLPPLPLHSLLMLHWVFCVL